MIDPGTVRSAVLNATDTDIQSVGQEVLDALNGDSNDAEHDALYTVAALLDLEWAAGADGALILPDGTCYEGRLQYDGDGKVVVQMARCGVCGFAWNDALITAITPTPAGRCPNEYNHQEEAS